MGLHPSALSRLLSEKAVVSPSTGLQIARKLNLPGNEQRALLRSLIAQRAERDLRRLGKAFAPSGAAPGALPLEGSQASAIFSVAAHALVALSGDPSVNDSSRLAARLGRPLEELETAVEALVKLGLLLRNTHGELTAPDASLPDPESATAREELLKKPEPVG